jgi:hypothetical protein
MSSEVHTCSNVPCKCNATDGAEFCNSFCEEVETSEDDRKCGCGHMACDYTKQMGNEQTFDATGS